MKILRIMFIIAFGAISCTEESTPTLVSSSVIETDPTSSALPPPSPPSSPAITMEPRTPVAFEIVHPDITISVYDSSSPIEIAFLYPNTQDIVFGDLDGNRISQIHFGALSPIQMEWSSESCKIFITTTNSKKIELWRMELGTNEIEKIFEGHDSSNGEWITWPMVSPSQKYVSYVIWSGEQAWPLWEFRDIEVLDLNGTELTPTRITNTRVAGVKGGIWAPKSDVLAFVELDRFGRQQLFFWDPDSNSSEQITNFDKSYSTIGSIKWSENEEFLAFIAYEQNGNSYAQFLNILPRNGGEPKVVGLGENTFFPNTLIIFSEDNSQLLVSRDTRYDTGRDGLYWIDVSTGEVISEFIGMDELGFTIANPFSINSNEIIVFYGKGGDYYYYDNKTKELGFWVSRLNLDPEEQSFLSKASIPRFPPVSLDKCINK